jgi:glycerol-3-phosphate acyltransferase PlsY
MSALPWAALGLLCGSLPFSMWIGRAAIGVDLRRVGDGNPGAANVFRAGGRGWAVLALLLDFAKGAGPVAVARWAGIEGPQIVPVALAPVVGHAFSPLLGFRGGKALTVTFGVWTGLTLWAGPLLLGLGFAAGVAFLRTDAWSVAFGMLALLPLGLLTGQPALVAVWLGNWLVLLFMQRHHLRHRPRIRPRLAQALGLFRSDE